MSLQLMCKGEDQYPIDLLLNAADELDRVRQRRHELWILSCYIDIKIIKSLVRSLAKKIRLVRVRLAFDVGEALKVGITATEKSLSQIHRICKDRGIEFDPAVLVTERLVHAKGYALLQRSKDGLRGSLLIGSANITKPGFLEGTNVELGFLTAESRHLRRFQSIFDDLVTKYRKNLDNALLRENKRLFRYALLNSGIFLSNWDENLRQLVGIRYKVKDKSKFTQLPEKLRMAGFELSDSLTHQILAVDQLPKLHQGLSKKFTKSFTVRTSIGRWCPKVIWARTPKGNFEEFRTAFCLLASDEALESALSSAREWQEDLIRDGLIKPVEPSFLEKWRTRIVELRNSEQRLRRIYFRFDTFPLPYGSDEAQRLDAVYSSIEDSVIQAGKKCWVIEKLQRAMKQGSISLIRIDEKAKELLGAAVHATVPEDSPGLEEPEE